jgi:hypothetical protein
MVPLFAILTVVTCIGVKSLSQRVRRIHSTEERKVRRAQWRLAEEAFLK